MPGKSLTITYLADAKSVLATQKQIDSGHTAMQSGLQKTGSFFKQAFGITAPLALAGAGAAVVKFGLDSVHAFEESQRVMAQTNAVLKSTGGAANVSAQQVSAFAATWQDFTGVEDEAIQSSENLLLTFRDVHNEVGKGNDIFNQAEVAILDMSTALNRGATPSAEQLQSATIQLGKALNDPISGMTALKRVGVSFSESQVATIKSLQESGDLMGAQKLILAELSKEFGGAAKAAGETFAGRLNILKANFNDIQEAIGHVIVDALEPFVSILSDLANTKMPSVSDELDIMTKAAWLLPPPLREALDVYNSLRDAWASRVEIQASQSSIDGWARSISDGTITVKQLQRNLEDAGASTASIGKIMDGVRTAVLDLAKANKEGADSSSKFADELHAQRKASLEAAAASREQRLAILGLADSFLGILDSAGEVSDAQKTLNQLQAHGKEGTEKYKDAVLDAIKAQAGLESSVLSYATELADAGDTQAQVIGKIQNLARHFGLQKDDLADLIAKVKEYVASLGGIPSVVHTVLDISRQGAAGVHTTWQHGFHGIVTRPTLALVGEAGPERVDVTPRGQAGGLPIYATININGGSNPEETARMVRDEIVKLQRRNGTSGIV